MVKCFADIATSIMMLIENYGVKWNNSNIYIKYLFKNEVVKQDIYVHYQLKQNIGYNVKFVINMNR